MACETQFLQLIMNSLKNNILLFARIILPAILCASVVFLFGSIEYFKYNSIYFIISLFGIILIILNLNKIKYNIIISLVLSLNLCFLVFFSSMAIGSGIYYFFKKIILFFRLNITQLDNIFFNSNNIVSIAIIAPLLTLYLYSFLFKTRRSSFFYLIAFSSIVILVILVLTKALLGNNTKMFIIWQFIVALALQLILYQKELKTLFKSKN